MGHAQSYSLVQLCLCVSTATYRHSGSSQPEPCSRSHPWCSDLHLHAGKPLARLHRVACNAAPIWHPAAWIRALHRTTSAAGPEVQLGALPLLMNAGHARLTRAACWGAGSEQRQWQLTPHPRTPVGVMRWVPRGWGAGRHPPKSPHQSLRMLRRASWRLDGCLTKIPAMTSKVGAVTTTPGKR